MIDKKEQIEANSLYISVAQLAALLGTTRDAVYKRINNGQIQYEKIAGRYLIPRKEFEGLVTKQLTDKIKAEIDKGVAKVVQDYGETLRLLGKE